MQAFEGHQFAAGTTIIHEGTRADAAFVLEKGVVEIYRSVGGREMAIARLGPGTIFGEMALLERRTHNAGVRAVEGFLEEIAFQQLREDWQQIVARAADIEADRQAEPAAVLWCESAVPLRGIRIEHPVADVVIDGDAPAEFL